MKEDSEKYLKEFEGENVSISFSGGLDCVIFVGELHTCLLKALNGRDYIVFQDNIDNEQEIPKVAVDMIKNILNDNNDLTLYCGCFDVTISIF